MRKGVPHLVLVDDADALLFRSRKWHVTKAGYVMANGKMVNYVKAPSIYLHRLIMGCEPGDGTEVDHKNRNPLDNRRVNLRLTTHAENMQNLGSHKDARTSQHRGVSYCSTYGTWKAIWRRGDRVYRRNCATELEAIAVVEEWRASVRV